MSEVKQIPVGLLVPSPRNPRKTYDDAALVELAESFKTVGQLEPILARPKDDHLEIVYGHRRWMAKRSIGPNETVDAIIREMTDTEALEAAIVENAQREDVHPMEEALAFEELIGMGLTNAEITNRTGKRSAYIGSRLRLLSLGKAARKLFLDNGMSLDAAFMLARVEESVQSTLLKSTREDGTITDWDIERALKMSMRKLSEAPWDLSVEYAKKPACVTCPYRTEAQSALFDDGMKTDGDSCTRQKCWDTKMDRFYKDQEKIFKAKKPESVVGNKFKKEDGAEQKIFSHRSISYGAPFVDLNERMRLTEGGPGVLGKQCVKPHESHVDKDGDLPARFLQKEPLTWRLGYELVFGHVPSPEAEGVVLARDDTGFVRYLLDKSVAKTITKAFKRESTEVNHNSGRTKEQEDAMKEERKKNRTLQKAGEQIAPALLDIAKRRFDPRALLLLLKSTYPFSRANDEKLQDMVHRLPELSESEAMTEMLQVVLLTLLSEKEWIKSKAIAEAARWIGYDIDGALDAILNPPKPEKKTRAKKKKEEAPAEAAGDVTSDEEE